MSQILGAGGGGSITVPLPVNQGGTGLVTITDHAVMVGSGTGAVTPVGPGTNGQLLIGSTGADPAWAALTSAGSTISITGGAGTLDLDVGATVATSFSGDAGSAVPAANVLILTGNTNITTAAAGNSVSFSVSGTTDHAVQVGNAGGGLTSLGIGATNQVLLGNTGADPSWGQVDLTAAVTGTLPVGNGGSGATTFTDHGVLLGSGAGAFSVTAVGATGTVLKGNTGADPTYGAVDVTTDITGTLPVGNGGTGVADPTDHSLLVGSGAGAMTELGVATNGQLPIGSTGADPVLATITAGTNISVTNGAGSITVNSTAVEGIAWNEVTGTTQAAAVNNGYITNNAGLVTVTLPATASVGSVVRIMGLGAGGWKLAQNASQYVRWDESTVTTTGVGGSLDSTDDHDAVELLCTVTNNGWSVLSSKGNISVT